MKAKDDFCVGVDPVDGRYQFYDLETGEWYIPDAQLNPCDYSAESGLFAGAEYTNQEQYNNEVVVMRFDKNNNEVLYRYTTTTVVKNVFFDNEGKYVIINGGGKSEVLDALSGTLLFSVDRDIRIINGIVYDVSGDLILPGALPYAEIYSFNEFIREGKKIIR